MYVLIVRNDSNAKVMEASYLLSAYLESQGIDCGFIQSSDISYHHTLKDILDITLDDISLVVVLGGDGTILRTANLLAHKDIPILGINFGHLGFLANSSAQGVIELVSRALAGELKESQRSNLEFMVICEGDRDPYEDETDGAPARLKKYFALNEVAISRGENGNIIDCNIKVSDCPIENVRSDGVIVATATGSTAYALAAGGPLVTPSFHGLIIQPLAPHTLTARTILTGPSDVVRIGLEHLREGASVSIFADGEPLLFERPIRCVYVMLGSHPTRLLYENPDHFFNYAASTFFGID